MCFYGKRTIKVGFGALMGPPSNGSYFPAIPLRATSHRGWGNGRHKGSNALLRAADVICGTDEIKGPYSKGPTFPGFPATDFANFGALRPLLLK